MLEVDYNYINMLDYLKTNVDITNLSNFKTKATTKYYYEINSLDDIKNLKEIYTFSKDNNLGFLIVGWWTNLLFAFYEFNWVIVNNKLLWYSYDKNSSLLESYSNELISDIASDLEFIYSQDLWYRFIWLPWSIWWAVFWNAWCFWLETESNFLDATVYDLETWETIILSKDNMDFSYRSSILKTKERYFLISARFDLSKKIEKYSSDVDNLDFRENKQPKWNSCWSFFKNPPWDNSAWKLIQDNWLKWFRYNSAYISDLHANFLMSDDNWSFEDLLYIINKVQDTVYKNNWIKLENEVRIIKW